MSYDKKMQRFEDLCHIFAGGIFATVIQSYFGTTYASWEMALAIIAGFAMIGLAEFNRRASP